MILRRWLRPEEKEANLERELRFHIEERVADMVRSGVSEEDARRRVRLEFGAAEQVKDECRDVRPARWAETFMQDIRYAWRNLRRNPGFAAVAIATLALGIGGLTAMFSAFDTILLRPLPYADPDRLVMVWDDLSKPSIGPSPPRARRMVRVAASQHGFHRHRSHPAHRCDTIRRRSPRAGPGPQDYRQSLERARRETADRACLQR